ncbi:MAG TPA: alpha-amylase family glycosyl hydrolase, partial [Chitinophagaceae bacterium]|nr:alpha-amylase family glycosyl hydrolase [Chitinophagaceae bacterium]
YHDLIKAAHAKGMKIIQDAVYNHVGIQHFFVRDMPSKDWLNQWPKYQNTSYKDQVLMDPYASAIDKKIMSDGWFTPMMPDLNHRNPFVANFLIQHAIWTVEEFGIDGWRIDTYAYNDLDFMNRCNKALLDEYPQLGIFGETWVHGIPNQSFFMENVYNQKYRSNLPGVTDFQLNLYGILPALNQPFGWTEGVNRLYLTATNDFVYKDAMKNCIFLDNHDMSRFYSQVGEDFGKYKMGIAWLLTFRGIPQLYYGTEILMKGVTHPTDAMVRFDFPGGWAGDSVNKFVAAGRTQQENEAFNYVRTLANFRKSSSAIKTGKMMQYVPVDGVYVYFRYDNNQTVMCVMNTNDRESAIDLSRFDERMKGFTKALDVATGTTFNLGSTLKIGPKYLLVAELKK